MTLPLSRPPCQFSREFPAFRETFSQLPISGQSRRQMLELRARGRGRGGAVSRLSILSVHAAGGSSGRFPPNIWVKEREYAAEQSARVIDAYCMLSKPLSRAMYIMKLEGANVDKEETISNFEFLSEIMEIREAVDGAADSLALNQIRSETQEKLKHWSDLFANAFQNQNFEEAVIAIRRMTYNERAIEEIVRRLS